jgi:hypothetical protein|tara:strand:+ start:394 stop:627 length:234 start_codon:yes stop_codon:yes gene_type:complete
MNKEQMIESLHKGVCKMTVKENVCNCTLHSNYAPQTLTEANTVDGTVSVWDIDFGCWRQFAIEDISNFKTSTLLLEN